MKGRSDRKKSALSPQNGKRSLLLLVFTWPVLTLYSAVVVYWMFIGFGREIHAGGSLQYNLVPLKTVNLYLNLENGLPFVNRLVNLFGNVAVFIPFGVLLPLVSRRLNHFSRLTFYMALCILLLEIMQMLLHVGSFDIDDLLLNILGVWIGYILFRLSGFNMNKREN